MDTQDPDGAALQANAAGMAALRQGESFAAITAFEQALALDPAAGPLWRNLAHARRLAQDDAGERAALDQALALDRTDFIALLRKAQNLERSGAEAEGLAAWSGALQLSQGIANPSDALLAELAAGRNFVNELQIRLGAAVTGALGPLASELDETEQRRTTAFTDHALGRRAIFRNECAGIHYPFLPADEFFDARHFPWFAELEAAAGDIRAELAGLLAEKAAQIRPYVQLEAGTPENKWTALDHSLDWSACFLWEYGQPNEPVLARCPRTAGVIRALPQNGIPGKSPNAFFSILKPRSRIPAHTGVTNTRAIIHLALDIPPGCGFRVGGETREWVEGKAFAFDDTIEHQAWNDSDQPRAILILDAWNPHLSPRECEAISRYFAAADGALAKN